MCSISIRFEIQIVRQLNENHIFLFFVIYEEDSFELVYSGVARWLDMSVVVLIYDPVSYVVVLHRSMSS